MASRLSADDHIEGVTITNPGTLTILGTNGDDDITVVGTGTTDFWFAINDGPRVDVTDAAGLEIMALAGDDDIEIDIDVTGALTAFDVVVSGGYGPAGHEPATDSDTVTVSGVLGDLDNPTWTPTGAMRVTSIWPAGRRSNSMGSKLSFTTARTDRRIST